MLVVFPYKNGSKSVKELIGQFDRGIQIKRENSAFKGRARKKVVNWGSSTLPEEVAKCAVLNKPEAVALASNKLNAFRAMAEVKGVVLPRFTTDKAEAAQFETTVVRHKLAGHSGEGIELVDKGNALPNAPLYVEYVAKKQEYRVHVFNEEVIDIQRKARKKEVADENVNWKIRNLDGGFIYARDFAPEDLPKGIQQMAVRAVKALGLDFGAVDVIYNQKQEQVYVLEVNTAPGLQGTTLEAYAKAIEKSGFLNVI